MEDLPIVNDVQRIARVTVLSALGKNTSLFLLFFFFSFFFFFFSLFFFHPLFSCLSQGDVGIIDGDSLLELLFSSSAALLDWSFGGQFVHLIELAERFLLQFVQRNVKIQVMFFQQGLWLWRDSPVRRLARQTLAAHLQSISSPLLETVIIQGSRWGADQHLQQIVSLDPNWILAFDSTMTSNDDVRRYFEAFAAHHLRVLDCHIVLVPGMEFRGNDIDAWVKFASEGEEDPVEAGGWDTYQDPASAVSPVPTANEAVEKALKAVKDVAVQQALRDIWSKKDQLSLKSRRADLQKVKPDATILGALNQFCEALCPMASAALVDCVDGRFLHHVIKNKINLVDLVKKSEEEKQASKGVAEASPAVTEAAAEVAPPVEEQEEPAKEEPEAAAAPEPVAEVLDSWDAAPSDSWADFDIGSIKIPGEGELAAEEAEKSAAAKADEAPIVVVVDSTPKKKASTNTSGKKKNAQSAKEVERLGNTVYLGEPKKKFVQKTKRERKGEQRAAHIEKLQSNSLLGRYVQSHVITLDRKQVKMNAKQLKIKAQAAASERSKQEASWKEFLKSGDIKDTAKANQFVLDNEFQEDLEFKILMQIAEESPKMELAMPVLAELVFRKCPEMPRLGALAEKWGFPGLAAQLRNSPDAKPDSRWIRRQLLETSELLPRERGEADVRVKHFRPDPWQKQLLDNVDANRSSVVVAPTSAGKTFIQYYVMEKVLREDDSSVVVYVCPTKALCNQVMAGVNARYQKSYEGSASVLCGIFLRDRRHRAESCQILVTVPDCLDVLLLNPTIAGQNWAKKIKWILFDEVHTINDPKDGQVWERILQLTTCPFLALSATVGQPEAFRDWLSGTRKEKVELIVHSERYNDLRLFVTGTGANEKDQSSILPLHPCTFVTFSQLLKEQAFPSLADFEAKDSFALWEAMVEQDDSAQDLAPELFFLDAIISRKRSKDWARAIKARMVDWTKSHPKACQAVLERFNKTLAPEDVLLTTPEDEESALFTVTQELLKNGPALLFCHSRQFTELMVGYYADRLSQMQKAAGPSQKKQKDRDRKAEALAKQKKQKEKRSKNKKEQEEAERYGDVSVETVIPVDQQYPVEFTLRRRDRKGLLGKEDREDLIRNLRYKTRWPDDHPLVQGLRRGVGCHHEGLPHRYRVAVELMFRTGDVTVVFATQTLAQGIHAPARSVVLVHDTPTFLTPTSLRQMTGRAGRRGYDLMGQVVFYGVTYARIRQLLRSRVPQMRGGFPLSSSLSLRLTLLQNSGASSKELIDSQVEQLLNQPLLSLRGERPEFDTLLRHYFDLNKNLMVNLGCLNQAQNKAIWLAALATHLSYLDPSNLAFIYCYGENLFQALCNVEDPSLPSIQEELIAALACIINPLPVHQTLVERCKDRVGTPYMSAVVHQVPEFIQKRIREYNAMVVKVFTQAAKDIPKAQDHHLPLSKIPVGCGEAVHEEESAVSVFAATSGVDEEQLSSLDHLVYCSRNDLCVDHTAVAVVPELTHINSYLIDFFRQLVPDANVIIKDNYLRTAWYKLSDFSQTLRVIAVAIAKLHAHHETVMDSNIYRMLSEDRDPIELNIVDKGDSDKVRAAKRVGNAFTHLSSEFEKKFDKTKK
jgi:ERCC4-related helicase